MMGIPGQEMIDMLEQENGNACFAEYVNQELGHKATTMLIKVTLDTYGNQDDGPRYKYMCSRYLEHSLVSENNDLLTQLKLYSEKY